MKLNALLEGLSFSDYFDDEVPYDVKPVPSLTPMEEQDFPIQSHNLFKNAYNESKGLMMNPEVKEEFVSNLVDLYSYLKGELQLKNSPKVFLVSDDKNANKILGKTAYYEPETRTVKLFITDRHPKDILRSFSHEVIHHWQHENNQLEKASDVNENGADDPQYAQKNPWLRQMEKQAYLLGNIMFRDWEDQKKAKDRKSGKKLSEGSLNENLSMDTNALKLSLINWFKKMAAQGNLGSYHKSMTSGDLQPGDYAEEFANKVMQTLEKQVDRINDKGDKYNYTGIESTPLVRQQDD